MSVICESSSRLTSSEMLENMLVATSQRARDGLGLDGRRWALAYCPYGDVVQCREILAGRWMMTS